MGSRSRRSKPANKYGRWPKPAAIVTLAVFLLALVGIAIELCLRESRRLAFYDRIPGIDLTNVVAERRPALVQELNRRRCTCGCGMTLARCRNVDSRCQISMKLARELATQMGGSQQEMPSNP